MPSVLVACAGMALGGLGGLLLGDGGAATTGVVVGGTLGVAAVALFHSVQHARLLTWLRRGHPGPPPSARGDWGELGYQVARALRAEEQAAEGERERLRQFLLAIEASPNGVLLLDRDDQVEWCNARAADHFGLDPQRDRRQRLTHLVRAPAFVGHLHAGHFDEPVNFKAPGGAGTLSVLVRRYGADMKLVLSQDLTAQERSDAMRRDFVANVSHEIRTPLTVLSGFIETLASLPLEADERAGILETMAQQARRMELLVGDLLTLAQLEGSPLPAANAWVSVSSLLGQVESDARALSAGRHALQFSAADGAQIAGAQAELYSAVLNLVNNAIRYTPAGGTVRVAWRLLPDVSGELAVTDTGPGIAAEHLPRLTERFYRVDGSRSRETGGTGLGLSIVKHVVQRHGGELRIESAPGRGSVFTLAFPAARIRRLAPAQEHLGGTAADDPAASALGQAERS